MPLYVPAGLPAEVLLQQEGLPLADLPAPQTSKSDALRVAILNLMPKKLETETQLLRILASTPLAVSITLLAPATHTSKNTPAAHLRQFYHTFEEVRNQPFDGLIITGAPVEHLAFEAVDYWPELCDIMRWSLTHVHTTMHICWGAQAALYFHYGIHKHPLPAKMFGLFPHRCLVPTHPLLRGFDEQFLAPHSRHTSIHTEDVAATPALRVLAVSEQAGLYLAASRDGRQVFVTGHSEYDRDTLAQEYWRDRNKGLPIALPERYFPNDDPTQTPLHIWRAHAHLLFTNWLRGAPAGEPVER